MATFVLVHGGWAGGWIWRRVTPLLRRAGHEVFTPTLTGLGERAHLNSPAVNLDTHAQDVAGVLEFEDLRGVILLGHSYGGMVITAAAELAAERLAQLVYLDAWAPSDGECATDLIGPGTAASFEERAREKGDGWKMPPMPPQWIHVYEEPDVRWMESLFRPQSLQTFLQPVRLASAKAAALPRTFIYCREPALGLFESSVAKAKAGGWRYFEMATGHCAPVTAPQQLADLLLKLA
ncbi:MAG: alpha/beta hydrolase [Acidobacteria bacterium]|nr:alpha/beta hydrolase [Acidobacteriota bacterium]